MMSWRKATRAMAGRGLASAQRAYALMGTASRFQFEMACRLLRGYADRQARPSQDILALSCLASVFNSGMLFFPVVGVVTAAATRAFFRQASTCRPPSRAGTPPTSSRRPSRRRAASTGDLEVKHHRVAH